MTEEEMAVDWIRSQGWNEETLPSDELIQMKKAFLAGLKAGKDMAEADLATVAYMLGADNQKKKAQKQFTKAEDIISTLYYIIQDRIDYENNIQIKDSMDLAKAFLRRR